MVYADHGNALVTQRVLNVDVEKTVIVLSCATAFFAPNVHQKARFVVS